MKSYLVGGRRRRCGALPRVDAVEDRVDVPVGLIAEGEGVDVVLVHVLCMYFHLGGPQLAHELHAVGKLKDAIMSSCQNHGSMVHG